ncbi:MAG: IS21-like element helper ATPase IstB [Mycolicibacterium insubricum]
MSNTANTHSANDIGSRVEFLARALKTPTIRRTYAELAERARTEGWTHEQYLATILERQVNEREANGTTMRIAAARFPATKTLEEFNFDHVAGLPRDIIAHLATGTWVAKADNVILLGPPGVGKTHLGIALGIKAAHHGYPVLFDTATGWAARLTDAHTAGRLPQELKRLRRYRLLILDEIGYLPFDADTANLFFQLIASRYEQGSILITSNMPFGRWGEVFADDIVAAALIDRLVHHAEVITINGDSYRTKARRDLVKTNK